MVILGRFTDKEGGTRNFNFEDMQQNSVEKYKRKP